MYSPLQLAVKYLRYYCTAANGKGHGTHSPFVFSFITKVLNDKARYEEYAIVESLRTQLKQDASILQIEEMGAGSTATKSNERTVSSIVKNAAKPKKFSQLLCRMVKYYQPQTVIELGTSLGISTSYMALANTTTKIITLEGSPQIANKASQNFKQLNLQNIKQVLGNFDDTLQSVIDNVKTVDFVFIDGNHRKEPTLRYFNQLLPYCHNDTILIFDDIHWSKEMEEAWHTIQSHPSVKCTIDLFFIGVVVFRQEFKQPQQFAIRF